MMQKLEQLLERFHLIDRERMRGLPFYNNVLSVEAVDFQPCPQGLLGALITPWFINVILLHDAQPAGILPTGSTVKHALPAGEQTFMVGEEEALGRYDFISLASPTLKFKTQQQAREFARSRVQQLMSSQPAPAEEKPLHYVKLADKPLSRRAFLRVT
jgi:[NiFe] hydrogenase assembly HybE family chaperone